MIHLSKSKYCGIWQCPKTEWLKRNRPEELKFDSSTAARMKAGNEIGDLAMGLFGNYTEVTVLENGEPDLECMVQRTREEIEKGTEIICEASFSYNGLYCAADILKKDGSCWMLYEVKSSTHPDKKVYIADVAYQKYVIEHCGIRISSISIVCINGNYVLDGDLNLNEFFTVKDVTAEAGLEMRSVEATIEKAAAVIESPDEPDIGIGYQCRNPYLCGFFGYCTRHLPEQSVLNLYRMPFENKISLLQQGIVSFEDISAYPEILTEKQQRQVMYGLNDIGTHINRDKIREFLAQLSYPLYFLDFETVQYAVPQYQGTKPFMQIPFQYSLHYIEYEGGELKHREFIADPFGDPRRAVAESLCRDIPLNVCTTAYSKSFECGRIRELAETFPDLSDHLMNICSNIADLLTPFQSGHYYNRAMGGSFSIKSVLPAIFPDDPALDYHSLDGVHNGTEAMTVFPEMKYMTDEERNHARNCLLKYCELDTYAMVKIWQELTKSAE